MTTDVDRLHKAYAIARDLLLARCRSENGGPAHWTGELSTSPLSTATAVMALEQVRKAGRSAADFGLDADFDQLIRGGLDWLAGHQNDDGGWGDTVKSISNISTTMLSHAVFHAAGTTGDCAHVVDRAQQYIDAAGGVPAVVARYGKDKTFSIPILTHCALAGLVDWKDVAPLPFELALLPARFYKAVRLPVVSYALPALIAIGQVRHHFCPTWNPLTRILRNAAIKRSLRVLDRIQPPNGGFLEAAPLTSFVTMSLAGKGLVDHVVVKRAVTFLCESVRPDGSWPIDTNLATWVTTLAINALKDDVPEDLRPGLIQWLLDQQYKEVHPSTNADPGGWAWTNLPGGVPDGDDTPGAMLALTTLRTEGDSPASGVRWMLDLQNRDGGFPTFCRGWGTLPFDRSSPDLSAHCLRALRTWLVPRGEFDQGFWSQWHAKSSAHATEQFALHIDELDVPLDEDFTKTGTTWLMQRSVEAIALGFRFLEKSQRPNGSWIPLWFGNQAGHDDENPVYGTSRVLLAYRDLGRLDSESAQRAAAWLASVQQSPPSGPQPSALSPQPARGWGGDAGIEPSVEETALAAEVLLEFDQFRPNAIAGIEWLIDRVEDGSVSEPSPIGFYFARLWYFEELYPLIFAVSALRRAVEVLSDGDQ